MATARRISSIALTTRTQSLYSWEPATEPSARPLHLSLHHLADRADRPRSLMSMPVDGSIYSSLLMHTPLVIRRTCTCWPAPAPAALDNRFTHSMTRTPSASQR